MKEFECVSKREDTFGNVFTIKMPQTHYLKSMSDVVGQLCIDGQDCVSHLEEDDWTHLTDCQIVSTELCHDVPLHVIIATVKHVEMGPSQVLKVNRVSDTIQLALDRCQNSLGRQTLSEMQN